MQYEIDNEREEIIKIIKANTIAPAPNQSKDTESLTLMYMVGNGKLFVTVQRDKNKKILSAFCIKNTGRDKVYVIIDEEKGAKKIFDALEGLDKKEEQDLASLYEETKTKKCQNNANNQNDHQR